MLKPNELSAQLRELVGNDDIKGGIELMKANLVNKGQLNQLSLKSARYEALLKKEHGGTIDYTTLEIEKNKLREALLYFADNLDFQEANTTAKKANLTPYIIAGIALILATITLYHISSKASPENEDQTSTVVKGPIKDTVMVNNLKEFLNAVKPNTHIFLGAGTYDLEDGNYGYNGSDYFYYADQHVPLRPGQNSPQPKPTLSSVKNLIITGEKGAKIMTRNTEVDVLRIINCENVVFENIFFGHTDRAGCTANVVFVKLSNGIKFKNCELNGSGFIGLVGEESTNIELSNSTISECTESFFTATKCDSVHFHHSIFENTKGMYGFTIEETPTFNLNDCKILDSYFNQYLFAIIDDKSNINITNSLIKFTEYTKGYVYGEKDRMVSEGVDFQ